MKKSFLSLLLVMSLCIITVNAAQDVTIIGGSVIKPLLPENHSILIQDDFDGNTQLCSFLWAGVEQTQVTPTGNTVGSMLRGTYPSLGWDAMSYKNYTMQYNVKVDYTPDDYVQIARLRVSGNSFGKVMLYKGNIIFEAKNGNTTITSVQSVIENFDAVVSDWMYLKYVLTDNNIKIYLNNTTTPILDIANFSCTSGCLSFEPSNSDVYIDNLMLSQPLPEPLAPIADPWVIPSNVKLASATESETVLYSDNFDTTRNMNGLDFENYEVIGDAQNKVSKFASYSNLGWGSMWLDDYTMKYNIRVDYEEAANWVTIAQFRKNWSEKYGKIVLIRNKGETAGKVVFQTVKKDTVTNEIWAEKIIENFDQVFKNKWVYIKYVLNGQNFKMYLNDEIILSVDNFNIPSGAIGLEPYCNMYMDNFMIVQEKKLPDVVPMPELTDTMYPIMKQNFETLQSGSIEELKANGFPEIWGFGGSTVTDGGMRAGDETNKAYNFLGEYISRDLKLSDFVLEFNAKIDFSSANCWPEISWNRSWGQGESKYKMYFGATDKGTVANFGVEKFVNNAKSIITPLDGEKPFNYLDANNIWAYYKIEKKGNTVKIYFNDKNIPCKTFVDEAFLSSGAIKIANGGAGKMYVDNLLLTTSKLPQELQINSEITGVKNINTTTVNCKLNVTNNYEKAVTPMIFLAAYNAQNTLIKVDMIDNVEILASVLNGKELNTQILNLSFEIAGNLDDYNYKIITTDKSTLKPIGNCISRP